MVPLELIDCPDRRLGHAVLELIARATAPRTEISVLLPRRVYGSILGRVLHDRTAEHIAKAISDVPHAVAIIVPFDASNRTGVLRAPPPPPTRTSGSGPSRRCRNE